MFTFTMSRVSYQETPELGGNYFMKMGPWEMEMGTRIPISNPQLRNVIWRENKDTGYVKIMLYPLNY